LGAVAITFVLVLPSGYSRYALFIFCPFIPLQIIAARRSHWSYGTRTAILISLPLVAAIVTYALMGFASNAALLGCVAVIFAALLLGQRAALAIMAALTLTCVGAATGFVSGWLSPAQPQLISPVFLAPWLRTTVIAALLWAMVGASISYVVASMQRAALEAQQALAELREEQGRREQAEAQRSETERSALKSQHLELVGQLAVGVAHDFNNVLQVIQGWSDLGLSPLAQASDRAEAQESLELATQQGSALARQLLTLGRHNARAPGSLALAEAVDGALRSLRRILPKDVEVFVTHQAGIRAVADASELQQVLFNLVINARDALPNGGKIWIRTGASDTPNAHLVSGKLSDPAYAYVAVRDNGHGIAKELHAQIFEPFFTTKAQAGTGLGLATVLSIARASGGGLSLDSTPNRGAEFSVYFPLETIRPLASLLPRVTRSTAPVRPYNVLLLEDNAEVRRLVHAVLTKGGYRVQATATGAQALDVLAQSGTCPFDLLCTDAVVPDEPTRRVIDAFQIAAPEAPILIVSGYVQEELTRRGIEQGLYSFLAKPFSSDELLRVVAGLIAKRETRQREAEERAAGL
jgi:signal transduction histidine kinase/ActR/RegA family two-component response regulator